MLVYLIVGFLVVCALAYCGAVALLDDFFRRRWGRNASYPDIALASIVLWLGWLPILAIVGFIFVASLGAVAGTDLEPEASE